jgi:hypothetical protein
MRHVGVSVDEIAACGIRLTSQLTATDVLSARLSRSCLAVDAGYRNCGRPRRAPHVVGRDRVRALEDPLRLFQLSCTKAVDRRLVRSRACSR